MSDEFGRYGLGGVPEEAHVAFGRYYLHIRLYGLRQTHMKLVRISGNRNSMKAGYAPKKLKASLPDC
jgi:hypothetical protein